MSNPMIELGVGGILALLVIREVFAFVRRRNGHNRGTHPDSFERVIPPQRLMAVLDKVEEMHRWHAKEDDEGVKIWYVRRSLEDAIIQLTSVLDRQMMAVTSQTTILTNLCAKADETLKAVKERD